MYNRVGEISDCLYLKDPRSSELGNRIVVKSIDLIYENGFDAFTFRKLAGEIKSTEASVYRYFESKHNLLLYLMTWYWLRMESKLILATANIQSPKTRLERSLSVLTEEVASDNESELVDEYKLHHIVISESAKVYMTKEVDKHNKAGMFAGYKSIVSKVSLIILEINPRYKYPQMLISTVIEGAHFQRYFAAHLPKLTNVVKGEDTVSKFYREMVFRAIQK